MARHNVVGGGEVLHACWGSDCVPPHQSNEFSGDGNYMQRATRLVRAPFGQFLLCPVAWRLAMAMTLLAPWLAGCGKSGPEMGRVAGKVTYKDQPLANATVTFVPSAEGQRPGIGITDASGNYRLTTIEPGDGALVGSHKVSIVALAPYDGKIPEGMGAAYLEEVQAKGKPLIPQRYFTAGSSELTADVKSGSNTCDFTLKD